MPNDDTSYYDDLNSSDDQPTNQQEMDVQEALSDFAGRSDGLQEYVIHVPSGGICRADILSREGDGADVITDDILQARSLETDLKRIAGDEGDVDRRLSNIYLSEGAFSRIACPEEENDQEESRPDDDEIKHRMLDEHDVEITAKERNHADKQYRDYLIDILSNGHESETRTGTDTIKSFGAQMRFDLQKGFPLLTSKAVWFEGIARELLWFLRGQTNIWHLLQHDVGIWTDDAYRRYKSEDVGVSDPYDRDTFEAYMSSCDRLEDNEFAQKWGDLGDVYGKMWRDYGGVDTEYVMGRRDPVSFAEGFDQIENLLDQLRENPHSRRLKVSAWKPSAHMKGAPDEDGAVLPPCHYAFQCFTRELSLEERRELYWEKTGGAPIQVTPRPYTGEDEDSVEETNHEILDEEVPRRALSLAWQQRSCDSFLGLPFNIASYALLTHLIARQVNMVPEEVIFQGGDCHIYKNHLDAVKELLSNEPSPWLPTLTIDREGRPDDLGDYAYEDFEITDYNHQGRISAPLAC